MKKFRALTLILAIVMMFSVASFSAFAEGETPSETTPSESTTTDPSTTKPTEPTVDYRTEGDFQYKEIGGSNAQIVGFTGTGLDCTIPEKIGGKKVVSIASGIVTNNSILQSVTIPGTVTDFSADSFVGCYNLKSITVLAGSLLEFDVEYCPGLEVVTLPENVKAIGKLDNCSMLQQILISGNKSAFKSVDGVVYSADGKTLVKYPAGKVVSRFVIPSTVTEISDYAFYQVKKNIKEIFVPKSVVKMGANTFKDASPSILFQVAKLPAGCKNAVNGLKTSFNQVNLYSPKKVTSTQTETSITLSWDKVSGATGYRVFRRESGKWVKIGDTTKLTATIKNLKAGTKHTYAVRAFVKNANGVTFALNYTTHYAATTPAVTGKLASAKNDSAIKLSWYKVSGATGYAVYYKNAKTGWKLYKDVKTERTITLKNLKAYTNYSFAVRAYIKTTDKTVLGTAKIVTVKTNIGTPVVSAKKIVENKVNKVEVTWTPSGGASHYQVFVKKNNEGWKLLNTYTAVKAVQVATTGLPSGTKLSFTVRAVRQESGKIVAKSNTKTVTVKV